MVEGKILVEKLLRYAEKFLYLNARDVIYIRNLLLREFKIGSPANDAGDLSYIDGLDVPDTLVAELEEFAVENGLCQAHEANLYSTYVFGVLSPLPSKVNEDFRRIKREEGVEKACEYFYGLCIKNNYVQKTAIAKNLKWEYVDGDKYLEITVNLSKPEKNNKEIAKLLTAPKSNDKYPACLLCKENEGYQGTLTHPARENIRTISLTMGGEPWFVQYSPYAYYNEHMIAISENHTPMNVDRKTVEKVLDFVDFFPNYTIGSNASLPIVGGSILNHEHFQGGEHLMPMHKAPVRAYFTAKNYPEVKVGVVDWYNSVVRLESENREKIARLAGDIVEGWKTFSCEDCYIYAETEGVAHNASSPIARKEGDRYIVDVILRNNITTEAYPEGLFHAHPEYHNIKKEGIGLIEAMGLFILPGRLKTQLSDIADILCGNVAYDEAALRREDNPLFVHREMIKELVDGGLAKDKAAAEGVVRDKVNEVCKNILLNTAVFKKDAVGEKGFKSFLAACGIYEKR